MYTLENRYNILCVDDNQNNLFTLSALLENSGAINTIEALSAKEGLEQLLSKEIDLILLDVQMPEMNGFEFARLVKSNKKTKDIPIIFLTAQTDIEYVSRAFEVGGVDYISKPFNGDELKARVKTHLQNVNYLKEIKEKQSKLAQLSITDPSSKLYNLLYFDSQIKTYQNRDESFWIIYIKIERFKKINELYGFFAANKIIKRFSTILKEVSYSNAIIARLYGINFGILLKDYDKKSIKKLFETLYVTVSKDKEIGDIISFESVLYNVSDSSIKIPTIYKNLELHMHKLHESQDKYLFIN